LSGSASELWWGKGSDVFEFVAARGREGVCVRGRERRRRRTHVYDGINIAVSSGGGGGGTGGG
jgi:hypothetical protein